MSGSSPKPLEANRRNAQRSPGPRTPTDGVAAISDRGSLTIALKPFGVLEATLVEKIAVAYASRFRVFPTSADTLRNVRYHNAIERQLNRAITQLYRLQEHHGLSQPQPLETPPIDQN